MREVLTIDVKLTGFHEVKGGAGAACMITFDGTASGPFFSGKILPGGVDTQKEYYGEPRSLSARYILEGTDDKGEKCSVFVENNGTVGKDGIRTVPKIFTDSVSLRWLETAQLSGTVEDAEPGHVTIRICTDEANC